MPIIGPSTIFPVPMIAAKNRAINSVFQPLYFDLHIPTAVFQPPYCDIATDESQRISPRLLMGPIAASH